MSRRVIQGFLCFVFSISACPAAIWPAHLGPYTRKSVEAAGPGAEDRGRFDEYGWETGEAADYGRFKVTASRFKDSTGAYAASLESPSIQAGNYTVTCSGVCPKDLGKLAAALPHGSHAAPPPVRAYLPDTGLIPRSERYILGPRGLQAFAPQITASAVAFQFGAEGEFARYKGLKGDETLALFSYPTPQMARQQAAELQKLPASIVKRSGPLVGMVLQPKDRASAEQLLTGISYHASISWDEPPPVVVKPQSVGNMLVAIIRLAGILVGFCVLSGLAFGAYRMMSRKFGPAGAQDPMILLRLSDK